VPFPSRALPCASLQARPRRTQFIDRPRERCQFWLDLSELSRSHPSSTDGPAPIACSITVKSVHASISPKPSCGVPITFPLPPTLTSFSSCLASASPVLAQQHLAHQHRPPCARLPTCYSRTTPKIRSDFQEVDVHARATIDVTRPLDTCPWPTLSTCLTLSNFTLFPAARSNSQTAFSASPLRPMQGRLWAAVFL